MNAALENYNYWNDPRVQAGMVDGGKIVEEGGEHYLVITIEDDEGCQCPEDADYSKCQCVFETELKLLCKYGVCPTCDGKGKHVNPSIDCGGITDWDDWDYDERDMYMSGGYDVTCNECKGLRVVPELDRDNNKKEDIQRYDDYMKAEWDHARETAAERAMGA